MYVDSFGLEYNPQEVLSKTKDKSITHIFRIQDDDSIMCGFFCITFIEYMLAEKSLLDYTDLFFHYDKIICKYFKDAYEKPWLYTVKTR